ncbi:MAG: oxidoreductase [Rhodovulum sulfidophilum]|uniref:Oxidoreductase n=1 Tax=Rhodovulum sulfidophilum TaxID=35806 RepID=A0A2W5MZ30_RHOSU|nr:MAG: oxidoreductase [Rhodovulum sulfidophilum]
MSQAALPWSLEVERVTRAAEGVVAIDLVDPAGGALPAWEPGAHIDIELAPGLIRQYSLMGSCADPTRYRVAILREPASRGGSERAHGLRGGERLAVGEPRNHFALAPAESYLFIAGGIGITPMLPMISAAEARGARWSLAYGGRARASMAFADELRASFGERVALYAQDEWGLIPLTEIFGQREVGTLVYCCGPEPLLKAVETAAASWPDGDSLHLERFSPKAPEPDQIDTAFEVYCARSGVTVLVPADRTILEVLEVEGVAVQASCYEGTCGTCETAVIEGIPDHRDSVLTQADQARGGTMLICVSRARSNRLVLDL